MADEIAWHLKQRYEVTLFMYIETERIVKTLTFPATESSPAGDSVAWLQCHSLRQSLLAQDPTN
jgi:hypothetical protein